MGRFTESIISYNQPRKDMVSYSKELATIKGLLEKNPQGMTITDISKALDIYRKTTAKYLDMLLITGQVEMRPFGPVKIYTPSRRVPVSSMLNLSRDYIIVFDRDMIVVEANENVLMTHGLRREDILGFQLGVTGLPYSRDEKISRMLEEGLAGKEFSGMVDGPIMPDSVSCHLLLLPLTFNDGSAGVSLMVVNDEGVRELEEDLKNRDTLLRALSYFVSYKETEGPVEAYLERGMERMGNGLNASRVYLSRNGVDASGNLHSLRLIGWAAPGIKGYREDGLDTRTEYSAIGSRLRDTLSRGRVFFGNVQDFPDDERRPWESVGVRSLALAPIFVGGTWWGFLGTDQWEHDWEWSSGEMEGLRTAAKIIGIILEYTGMEDPVE